jgi:type 1 glutamine amidotransferase
MKIRQMLKSPRFHMIPVVVLLAAAAVQAGAADNRAGLFRPGLLRVLILSGRNGHDWRTTTPWLRKLLDDAGRFDVRVTEEPHALDAEALGVYDALVVDYCGPRWSGATEKAVESFVAGGKGMVVVHGAIYGFSGFEVTGDGHVGAGVKEPVWTEFGKMVGGRWTARPPKQFHGQRHSFAVKILRPDHPIVQGMKETFTATDELYHGIDFLPETQILAAAYDAPEQGGTGKQEPMLTAREYGKGRVFYTALGHETPAMQEAGFIATFVRGVEWAASGKVTLPPDVGTPRTETGDVRVLLVTGGHDYDSSFYSVFDQKGLAWTHVASNQEAFKNDVRRRFDVVALYDMSADLDEKGRVNLRDFLESGKGLVVLHHAIADYTGTWPWWYEEVTGGRYLQKPEGDRPGSTYKHDEELFVKPAGRHPITDPIGPMHLWDETYKGMWISPQVKVLLTTDNPTSDGPVAWISPYAKSRVVVIQLGHDALAFRHPAYQALVRNAILWAAGKLTK